MFQKIQTSFNGVSDNISDLIEKLSKLSKLSNNNVNTGSPPEDYDKSIDSIRSKLGSLEDISEGSRGVFAGEMYDELHSIVMSYTSVLGDIERARPYYNLRLFEENLHINVADADAHFTAFAKLRDVYKTSYISVMKSSNFFSCINRWHAAGVVVTVERLQKCRRN